MVKHAKQKYKETEISLYQKALLLYISPAPPKKKVNALPITLDVGVSALCFRSSQKVWKFILEQSPPPPLFIDYILNETKKTKNKKQNRTKQKNYSQKSF